jgi:hypothetical protein
MPWNRHLAGCNYMIYIHYRINYIVIDPLHIHEMCHCMCHSMFTYMMHHPIKMITWSLHDALHDALHDFLHAYFNINLGMMCPTIRLGTASQATPQRSSIITCHYMLYMAFLSSVHDHVIPAQPSTPKESFFWRASGAQGGRRPLLCSGYQQLETIILGTSIRKQWPVLVL